MRHRPTQTIPPRAFAERAAALQGDFRDTSPTISPEGRAPGDAAGLRHRHLLALGHEWENLFPNLRAPGGAIDFFRERSIHWWRSSSTGDQEGIPGPTRNLTSSQLLCVNFLMPLGRHSNVMLAMLNSLDGDIEEIVPIKYASSAGEPLEAKVDFEFVGLSGPLEGGSPTRGAHVTSCDAVVLVRTRAGNLRIYLMEWKYAEQYVGAKSKATGAKGRKRLARYTERYSAADGPFSRFVPVKDVLYDPLYQIVRLGLLGDKLCRERTFGIDEARVLVVCPEGNAPYRDTVTSPALKALAPVGASLDEAVQLLWKVPTGFRMTSPEALIGSMRPFLPPALANWDAYMRERYHW